MKERQLPAGAPQPPRAAPLAPLKSRRERVVSAVAFETIAIGVCTPLFSWVMGTGLFEMGGLTLATCVIALVWNVVFNTLFDQLQQRWGFERGVLARTAHSLLFELGLLLATVPLAAWWLAIGWWAALLLDLALIAFFVPYTWIFHYAWDHWRLRWVQPPP